MADIEPSIDAFCFAIVLSYAITDLSALQGGFNTYPLAGIYQQATAGENGEPNLGATFGLLFIIFISSFLCCIGTLVTVSNHVAQLFSSAPFSNW
jgi:choline transport protein